MKTEIEARILDIDAQEIIDKLESLNATFVGDWLQLRNCYDFNPVKPNSWIRLRTNGKETTLTIKEIENLTISGTKELEIIVSNFEETDKILNKLGYKARSSQENRRIRYMLDGVEIDIDSWPKIPTYLEIEANTQEEIISVLKKLDIDKNKLVTLDVVSIYSHYGLDFNSLPKTLLLEENRK
ncbi:MAG: CYTH domain-containing protein [Clostridia bacterium]|nr:CYTH domain-containing protein [Clostridia bacterium]